ncbi:phosphorylated carbohydrates phosphatase [Holospora obtusa F1]|uniref:Phosphorylated carbohydrates phosphatase n=1 Tax=Holospora obtusa F1 TaxID=1399147 RepID=W6TGG8_HOLOB|nr:HAD-IA family hydrolase [Holospora obtusa]ETZ06960.1 phosphorylated carbohydrates phosphatase [Holospora obtusa F1]
MFSDSLTRWILLDFDNSLMATERLTVPLLIERFNALYKEYITDPLTESCFYAKFHGKTKKSLCEHLSDYFKIHVKYEDLYHEREHMVINVFRKNCVEMANNVIETLTIARQRYKLALVTNSALFRVFSAMRWAKNKRGEELAKLFGTSFFESGNTPKPLPDVYFFAMNELRTLPMQCLAVEDSVTGAKASIGAGITTFGYTGFSSDCQRSSEQLKAVGVKECFEDWEQFLNLI